MLESIPFVLILGTVLGFLSGIGVGGGSLLMLWLTAVVNMPPETARSVNLLFFLPSALIACFFRWKQGVLDLKTILPAVISGCLAAALFSWVGTLFETSVLKKLFGGLLILTGLREVFYKEKGAS
ncbi:MAG: sulfite exporter TauE/SafE family protein [Oscillospiraceae bacterium]|nr:sulfite exporter TauE/SafE family protein [Oscillospiraceae bacterium]MBQ7129584.1 sulfite exporter TauE/SafE family protein [Oscillospiraceae bacterium]